MSIEFDGFEEVMKSLDKPVSQERLNNALMKACLLVEAAAKRKVDVFRGTGDLGRSITSRVEFGSGIVYTPLEYAPYVEYGTGLFAEEGGRQDVPWCYQDDKGEWHTTYGQEPKPYMRPALDENREEIKRILREGLLND